MRKRDPNHTTRLAQLQAQSKAEWLRQVSIVEFTDLDYVSSEVLVAIIHAGFGADTGQYQAAVHALHQRIVSLSGKHLHTHRAWADIVAQKKELPSDAVQYAWQKVLEDINGVPNSEVRFAVFLANRIDDFMRHQLTFANKIPVSDEIEFFDDEREPTTLANTLVDTEGETPEECALRQEQQERVLKRLMGLPELERTAFYLREINGHDWAAVAKLMGCTIPTARKHHKSGKDKLQGEL